MLVVSEVRTDPKSANWDVCNLHLPFIVSHDLSCLSAPPTLLPNKTCAREDHVNTREFSYLSVGVCIYSAAAIISDDYKQLTSKLIME